MNETTHFKRNACETCACVFAILLIAANALSAQGPKGRSFGFGLSLGEPTAVTFRIWESRMNSWDIAVGTSHLGNPHIHADYLWHFPDAFSSRIVSLYAGVGAVLGFGEKGHWVFVRKKGSFKDYWYHDDEHEKGVLIAAKGAFGLNIIPRNTPIDIFLEVNPVIGLIPGFGFDILPALGFRFYP